MADVNGDYLDSVVSLFASSDKNSGREATYSVLGASRDSITPSVSTPTAAPLTATTPITIIAADNTKVAQMIVVATFGTSSVRELVWDSVYGFNGMYTNVSNVATPTIDPLTLLTKTWTIVCLRDGGWPGNAVKLTVYAVDDAGNLV